MELIEEYGYEFLYGTWVVEGDLLGGCLESLSEMITGARYSDQGEIYKKFGNWSSFCLFD
jgi:bacteriocin immunity protein (putative)